MKRKDYLLALTSAFLSAPEEKVDEAIDFVNSDIELYTPGKPGVVSLGGASTENKRSGFVEWMQSLRQERIQGVKIFHIIHDTNTLPDSIASAFFSEDLIIEITTLKKQRKFLLQIFLSRAFQITPEQFVELIDYQKYQEKLWVRIRDLVEEFVQLNSIFGFSKNQIKEFIVSEEGIQVFEFLAPQLLQEIQIECQINEMKFEIPKTLKNFFYKSDFPFGEPEKDSVFLYTLKDPDPDELLKLINAQPFAKEIWKNCEKEFKGNPHEEIPALKASEWNMYIKKQIPSSLKELCSIICGIIVGICEEKEIKLVIPAELSHVFGPDEMEEKRAQARGRTFDHWILRPYKDPWELYFFELLPENIKVEEPISLDEAEKSFSNALQQAANFAAEIDSTFREAFLLGSHFLKDEFIPGNFDKAHFKSISKDLKKKEFSKIALKNTASLISYAETMNVLSWPVKKISGLLAASISDVFGGMGLWNDIYLENETHNEKYLKVSAELFISQRNYLAALLTSS